MQLNRRETTVNKEKISVSFNSSTLCAFEEKREFILYSNDRRKQNCDKSAEGAAKNDSSSYLSVALICTLYISGKVSKPNRQVLIWNSGEWVKEKAEEKTEEREGEKQRRRNCERERAECRREKTKGAKVENR